MQNSCRNVKLAENTSGVYRDGVRRGFSLLFHLRPRHTGKEHRVVSSPVLNIVNEREFDGEAKFDP